jgi:DNA-binding protein HU-beta
MAVVVTHGLQQRDSMTYLQLIAKVSEETQYTKREVRSLLRQIARTIGDSLIVGQNVQWDALGTFLNLHAAAKRVRNYKTGEWYWIDARRRIKFKPSIDLRLNVANSTAQFQESDVVNQYLPKETADGKVRSGNRPKEGRTRKDGRKGAAIRS